MADIDIVELDEGAALLRANQRAQYEARLAAFAEIVLWRQEKRLTRHGRQLVVEKPLREGPLAVGICVAQLALDPEQMSELSNGAIARRLRVKRSDGHELAERVVRDGAAELVKLGLLEQRQGQTGTWPTRHRRIITTGRLAALDDAGRARLERAYELAVLALDWRLTETQLKVLVLGALAADEAGVLSGTASWIGDRAGVDYKTVVPVLGELHEDGHGVSSWIEPSEAQRRGRSYEATFSTDAEPTPARAAEQAAERQDEDERQEALRRLQDELDYEAQRGEHERRIELVNQALREARDLAGQGQHEQADRIVSKLVRDAALVRPLAGWLDTDPDRIEDTIRQAYEVGADWTAPINYRTLARLSV